MNKPMKQSMKLTLTIVSLSLFTLLLTPFSVSGQTEKKEKNVINTNHVEYPSLHAAWKSIQNSADKIGNYITSTNFIPIKDLQKEISAGLRYLHTNSVQIAEEQSKNLEEALNDVEKSVIKLQKSADENLVEPTKREYEELKKTLKSIEIKYPKIIIHPTNNYTNSNITNTTN